MKTASIICTIILLGLLWLVLSQAKRDGFIILLDESYRAEIVADGEKTADFPASQIYENIANEELRRAVEDEENFTPESVFQTGDVIYLADGKRGKLSRFSSPEGLKAIAVFGGELKKLQSIGTDKHGNIYVSVQAESENQKNYLVRLLK
jgi:hypothetical protein